MTYTLFFIGFKLDLITVFNSLSNLTDGYTSFRTFNILSVIKSSGSFSFLLIAGALFGAFKLSCRFNVEYEYIVTNGTMDIDKIINKSSRKRVLSFELATVSRLEKFNQGLLSSVNSKEIVTACNLNDPEAYLMVSSTEGKGTSYLIFAPDERVRGAIVKFVPKFIANSAFK